jgi:hypothetical protein
MDLFSREGLEQAQHIEAALENECYARGPPGPSPPIIAGSLTGLIASTGSYVIVSLAEQRKDIRGAERDCLQGLCIKRGWARRRTTARH